MALRSLNNALPDAIQRPKKVAKVSAIPLDKASSPGSVENMNPTLLPNAADQSSEYIVSEDLKPLGDPEARIKVITKYSSSGDGVQASLPDAFLSVHSGLHKFVFF
ncbi:hypothetical protein HPP92_011554 [Vanilla planifolia]|uniref:Uncharacterized protein n=1 Tax=Vanilla planifolia TaxID=51239 RepID=A0A835R110_VANPL|nr:hypothetical protein HPP92_011554 [Vanilla planifolia]